MNQKNILLSLLLIAASLFLYFPSLKYYFFQDDFYTLLASQAQSFKDFLHFFIPGQEIYYRPLSMRIYFYVMQLLNAQAIHFHIISLGLHISSSFLVWKIVKKLSNSYLAGWLTAFLYATSSIHFINLYWIAEVGLVVGTFFYLLSVLSFLKRKNFLTFTFFILGLLSHEYLVTLPAALILISWYKNSKFENHAKYWLVSLIYLGLRLFIFPLTVSGTYVLTFGKTTFKAIFWYFFWSLNLLENLKDQLLPGMQIRPEFMENFPLVSIMALILPILTLIFYLAAPVQIYSQQNSKQKSRFFKTLIFCLAWIFINLSIPLMAPDHIYPIYFSLSLFGFVFWLSHVSLNYSHKVLSASLLAFVWFLSSFYTLRLTEKIHWTVQEANKARQLITQAQALKSQPQPQTTFVFRHDYQSKQALYDQDALRFIFKDQLINTFYGNINSIIPQECKAIKEDKPRNQCLADYNIYVINQ